MWKGFDLKLEGIREGFRIGKLGLFDEVDLQGRNGSCWV